MALTHNSGYALRFEESTKLQERGGIGGRFTAEVELDEVPQRGAVGHRIFYAFVTQTEPLLNEVQAQHAF